MNATQLSRRPRPARVGDRRPARRAPGPVGAAGAAARRVRLRPGAVRRPERRSRADAGRARARAARARAARAPRLLRPADRPATCPRAATCRSSAASAPSTTAASCRPARRRSSCSPATTSAGRLEVQRLLSSEHWFARRHVLWLDPVREGEPVMSGRLILDPEIVERLTTGTVSLPRFSTDFPAEHIETEMEWDDVVLHPDTRAPDPRDRALDPVQRHGARRLGHAQAGQAGLPRAVPRPARAPARRSPRRCSASTPAGRCSGSTCRGWCRSTSARPRRTSSRLFDKAEHKDWILFFDEADALFGKRTEVRDAHDKYANQEVAYLLQRIESYAGLVILATNQRGNVDEAFLRRFQAVGQLPDAET